MNAIPMLTFLTALPVAGALSFWPLADQQELSPVAPRLAFSLPALVLTLILWIHFNPSSGGLQFQEQHRLDSRPRR